MNRSILGIATATAIYAFSACTAPDGATHTARDVPDEPAAKAPADKSDHSIPLADRMRGLDRTVYKVNVDDLPAIGPATAPLTIVLFSDYECSFCRKLEPQIAQLRAEHGSDVRIVIAPRPLPFHQRAKPAALAAIAAAEQGKLESMHRALIALDGKLDEDALTDAARTAGLDLARFETDRKSAKAETTLAKSEELATRFSVRGTPTTFLNGLRITGAVPDVVRQLGEEQLAIGRGVLRQGTPPARIYDTLVAAGLESAAPDPTISTIRVVGGEGPNAAAVLEHLADLTKCWGADTPATPKTIELTIAADGRVTDVVTDPAQHDACVRKAAGAWTLKTADAQSKLKLVFNKP